MCVCWSSCWGWVAISYSFIARPMRLVDTLAAAAEQLAQPGEEPIELPEPMEDLEGQLNASGNGPCGTPGLPGRQSSGKTIWWSIWPMI